jgi:hypothetical protein
MSLTKTERRILKNVIHKLGPNAPVSGDAKAALQTLRLYLDTWVIAPLQTMAREDRTVWDLREAEKISG